MQEYQEKTRAIRAFQVTIEGLKVCGPKFDHLKSAEIEVGDWIVEDEKGIIHLYADCYFRLKYEEVKP